MKVLIFVYDEDSGFFSRIKRHVKGMFAPQRHKCKLYRLTYGRIFMKRTWRNFLGNLSCHKVFFTKKEFKWAHPEFVNVELPVVLLKDIHGIKVLITAKEINETENVDDLIGLLGKKLSGL